jgi:serine/arginine repetitive matrix protein 2
VTEPVTEPISEGNQGLLSALGNMFTNSDKRSRRAVQTPRSGVQSSDTEIQLIIDMKKNDGMNANTLKTYKNTPVLESIYMQKLTAAQEARKALEEGARGMHGGGKKSKRRKSSRRKSTRRKSTRRKSTRRKSTRRKSTRRKSKRRKSRTHRR